MFFFYSDDDLLNSEKWFHNKQLCEQHFNGIHCCAINSFCVRCLCSQWTLLLRVFSLWRTVYARNHSICRVSCDKPIYLSNTLIGFVLNAIQIRNSNHLLPLSSYWSEMREIKHHLIYVHEVSKRWKCW